MASQKNPRKTFKIHLNSEDRKVGTTVDGTFFVDLPFDIDAHEYQIALESFDSNLASDPAYAGDVLVTIGWPCPEAFSSSEDGPSSRTVLAVVPSGVGYIKQPVTRDTIGAALPKNMIRSRLLRIILLNPDSTPYRNAPDSAWFMTLVVY